MGEGCLCEIPYRVEIVQQLGELKQSLRASGPAMVAGQAVQLLDVGGPQLVKAVLVLQALHRYWGGGGTEAAKHGAHSPNQPRPEHNSNTHCHIGKPCTGDFLEDTVSYQSSIPQTRPGSYFRNVFFANIF